MGGGERKVVCIHRQVDAGACLSRGPSRLIVLHLDQLEFRKNRGKEKGLAGRDQALAFLSVTAEEGFCPTFMQRSASFSSHPGLPAAEEGPCPTSLRSSL